VLVLDALEARELWSDVRPRSTAELTDVLRTQPVMVEALELLADGRPTARARGYGCPSVGHRLG